MASGGGRTDGVVVRPATDDDADQIVALQAERNGTMWGPVVRSLLERPDMGPSRFTVAVDGDRVVSSLCVLPACLRVGAVDLPVGQPEFVATAPTHEHRGLVRAQLDLVHAWSAARGDLVQVITGIAYFYRRFGYEYAISAPRVRLVVPGATPARPDGWSVRRATADDAGAVARLQEMVGAAAGVSGPRDEAWWRWTLGSDQPAPVHVAERDGVVRGAAAIAAEHPAIGSGATILAAVAHDDGGALDALLAEAGATGKPVAFEERGRWTGPLAGISVRHPAHYALYVRVADPVAVLDRLRPELSARLAASVRAGSSGRLVLSIYTGTIVLTYEAGEVVAVEAGPPDQETVRKGGAAVPPDLVATLLFGRYGAAGLDDRHDDVRLGPSADLVETLFPRLDADVPLLI